MTQLSRERLENLLQHNDETSSSANAEMWEVNEMARRLLAAEAQEPVAWAHRLVNKRNGVIHPWIYGSAEASPSEGDVFRIEVMPLYAAPQPVAVPDVGEFNIFTQAGGVKVAVKDGVTKNHLFGMGWNACRAAILKQREE